TLLLLLSPLWLQTALAADTASAEAKLIGYWRLNSSLSDDGEKILAERRERDRKEIEAWLRRRQAARGPAEPAAGEDEAAPPPPTPSPAQVQRRRDRDEAVRRMLGFTKALEIRRSGEIVEIVSDLESRRIDTSTRTAVSLPEGQLADMKAEWDGTTF